MSPTGPHTPGTRRGRAGDTGKSGEREPACWPTVPPLPPLLLLLVALGTGAISCGLEGRLRFPVNSLDVKPFPAKADLSPDTPTSHQFIHFPESLIGQGELTRLTLYHLAARKLRG